MVAQFLNPPPAIEFELPAMSSHSGGFARPLIAVSGTCRATPLYGVPTLAAASRSARAAAFACFRNEPAVDCTVCGPFAPSHALTRRAYSLIELTAAGESAL